MADSPLRDRWCRVLAACGVEASRATPVWDGLALRHREPGRRYHTLTHLTELFEALDRLLADADDPLAVSLAAFYHDAVYEPTATDNEAQSAALARHQLSELGVDDERVEEVARMVELTRSHRPAPGDTDGSVLCDADLAILGSSAARYDRYAAEVREEYGHVDEDAWRAGRVTVLDDLLDRSSLYSTSAAQEVWDAQAQANLRRERARLRSTS